MSNKKNNTHLESTKKNPSKSDLGKINGESKTQAEVIKKSLDDMVKAIDKEKSLPETESPTSKIEQQNKEPSNVSKEAPNNDRNTLEENKLKETKKPQQTKKTAHDSSVNQKNEQPKKAKSAGLALLLSLAGVGLGGYSFYQLNYEKNKVDNKVNEQVLELQNGLDEVIKNQPNYKQLTQKIEMFDSQLNQESSNKITEQLAKKISTLTTHQAQLLKDKANIESQLKALTVNNSSQQQENSRDERVTTHNNQPLEKILNDQAQLITDLQQRVIKLDQAITFGKENSSETVAGKTDTFESAAAKATQKMSDELAKKEINYLVNMAVNKVKIEKDLDAAKQLLEEIKQKGQGSNLFSDEFLQSIDHKLVVINQFKPIDTQLLENQLTNIAGLSEQLKTKVLQKKEVAVTKEKEGVFNQIKSIALSGVKFTPKDPSKIDISAETSLIEKRLIKADIEQAKFALKTQNQQNWDQLLTSINQRLVTNFEKDAVFSEIIKNIQQLQSSSIIAKMPVLDSLKTLLK